MAAYVFTGEHIARLDGSPVVRWRRPVAELLAGMQRDACSDYYGSLWLTMNVVPELADERAITRRTLH